MTKDTTPLNTNKTVYYNKSNNYENSKKLTLDEPSLTRTSVASLSKWPICLSDQLIPYPNTWQYLGEYCGIARGLMMDQQPMSRLTESWDRTQRNGMRSIVMLLPLKYSPSMSTPLHAPQNQPGHLSQTK